LSRYVKSFPMRETCLLTILAGLLIASAPARLVADPGDIHSSAQAGKLPRVEALLAAMPEALDARDGLARTPLHAAALAPDARVLAFLLERGAEVNAKDAAGETPLFVAARAGRVESVRRLLAGGAEVRGSGHQRRKLPARPSPVCCSRREPMSMPQTRKA
jgi:ankyrin repeat protein